MDVFLHFDIGMKEKNAKCARLEIYFLLTFAMCLAHLTRVNGSTIQLAFFVDFRHVLSTFNLRERIHDPVSVMRIAFMDKRFGFWIKVLEKYFICHCSLFYNSSKDNRENTNSEICEIFRNSSDRLLAFLELNHSGLTGTQSSLGRPDFYFKYYLNTEILTLENVTCTLLLLKRPTTSQKGVLVGGGRGGVVRWCTVCCPVSGHFSLTL